MKQESKTILQPSTKAWIPRRWNVFLLAGVLVIAFLFRIWRFAESGEISEDEAFYVGMCQMLFNRETLWGWIAVLEVDYGLGALIANAANFLLLRGLSFPINEYTVQLPSLFFGVLGIGTAYLATKEITRDRWIAFVLATMMAVIPAQVCQSRSIAGNWIIATCLFWWVLYCAACYARRPSKRFALYTGLVLAAYLQTDGMQILFLTFLPILFLCLGAREQPAPSRFALRTNMAFGIFVIFCSLLITEPGLRLLLGNPRIDQWNPEALIRLGTYATVFSCSGILVILLAVASFKIRAKNAFVSLLRKVAHPLFLIPASTSFAINIAIAWSTLKIFDIPKGILGHAFAKEGSTGVGLYLNGYFDALLGILGWPLLIFVLACVGPAIWACRQSRGVTALGIWCLLSNLPWIFFVASERSVSVHSYMLTCSTALVAFAVAGFVQVIREIKTPVIGFRRAHLRWSTLIGFTVVSGLIIATVPFAFAQVTQMTVLGVSMPYKNGAILPSDGTRAAFGFLTKNAKTEDVIFTDRYLWIPRFYLHVKGPKMFPRHALRALPYPRKGEILSYFEREGMGADWYVVSAGFMERIRRDQLMNVGLRAVAKRPGGETQIWQRGYTGPVEDVVG